MYFAKKSLYCPKYFWSWKMQKVPIHIVPIICIKKKRTKLYYQIIWTVRDIGLKKNCDDIILLFESVFSIKNHEEAERQFSHKIIYTLRFIYHRHVVYKNVWTRCKKKNYKYLVRTESEIRRSGTIIEKKKKKRLENLSTYDHLIMIVIMLWTVLST